MMVKCFCVMNLVTLALPAWVLTSIGLVALIFNSNWRQEKEIFFLQRAMLNSRSRWILPIPSNFRQGFDPSVMTIRFPSREVKFLPSLAREFWQFCEWNLTNIGLHRLADRAISNAKKLNVVMPVNASNICYGSYRPVTVCVKDVSRLREYAQQNHIFFIRTVSKAWPSVLVLDILY